MNRYQWPAVEGESVLSIIRITVELLSKSKVSSKCWRKLLMKTTTLMFQVGMVIIVSKFWGMTELDLGQQAIADDFNEG